MTNDTPAHVAVKPLLDAIDVIHAFTGQPWTAQDFAEESPSPRVDAAIAMILNAVVSGALVSARAVPDDVARLIVGQHVAPPANITNSAQSEIAGSAMSGQPGLAGLAQQDEPPDGRMPPALTAYPSPTPPPPLTG